MYTLLDNSVKTQPDAIEKYFCVPFGAEPQMRMTPDLSEALIKMTFLEKSQNQEDMDNIHKDFMREVFGYQVLNKRLEVCFNYTLSVPAKVFLTILTKNNPGNIVMYLTYLQYISKKKNLKNITIGDICSIFPNGFPSADSLEKVWDGQKVKREPIMEGGDNLVDCPQALESILN